MTVECSLIEAMLGVEAMPEFHNGSKARALEILSALRGYLTEHGTTGEQDVLLYDIGVMTEKPLQYAYWKQSMGVGHAS